MIRLSRGRLATATRKDFDLWIDWAHASPKMLVNEEKPLAMTRRGAFFFADYADLRVWSGKASSDIIPDIEEGREAIYLPFQGWENGLWFDGPLLRFTERGLVDIVLSGRGGALDSQGREPIEGWRDWAEEESFFSLKDSLITAYRKLGETSVLNAGNWDRRTVLHLTMHRLAFPETRFYLHAKDLSPPWKRLCQNLNIEVPRFFEEKPARAPQKVAEDELIVNFLVALQDRAPYVPEGLARDLGIARQS